MQLPERFDTFVIFIHYPSFDFAELKLEFSISPKAQFGIVLEGTEPHLRFLFLQVDEGLLVVWNITSFEARNMILFCRNRS
jgi:hypothetical protein